jgi:hypothetical protein
VDDAPKSNQVPPCRFSIETYSGTVWAVYTVADDVVTVTTDDGATTSAPVGKLTAGTVARQLLRELVGHRK